MLLTTAEWLDDQLCGVDMTAVLEPRAREIEPQGRARELIAKARAHGCGSAAAADRVASVVDGILARPEHAWFETGAEEQTLLIRAQMEERYGQ